MKHLTNVSAQKVSWVKSNKERLDSACGIRNLYYPESVEELITLIRSIQEKGESFDLIGHSSNSLFMPTYVTQNLICTKYLRNFTEDEDYIYCDCGVSVSVLSRYAVEKGYEGFSGLCDLPGTIASGIYGNCSCYGCSVIQNVVSMLFLTQDGSIIELLVDDLKPTFRSTSLKRHELMGTILTVKLQKIKGDKDEIKKKADSAHSKRKSTQPTGYNNLGSTFNGGKLPTLKGYIFKALLCLLTIKGKVPQRKVLPWVLFVFGQSPKIPAKYLWNWGRWLFLDEESHLLLDDYYKFLKTLFKDIRYEIEIKK